MHHGKIYIGGVYLVRFAPGVNAKAEIVRALSREEALQYPPVRSHETTGKQPQIAYECRLAQTVGEYRKGYTFVVRARSIKQLVEAPPAEQVTAKTPNDLRHLKHPEASPATNAGTPAGTPPSFLDMAQRAKAAQGEANKLSLLMRVNIDLTLPLPEVEALLRRLEEYQPVLHVMRPAYPLPTD